NDIDDTAQATSVELNVQAGLSTTQAGTVNLNMSGNNLNAGGLRLDEKALGTLNITQASAEALASLNGNPAVTAIAGTATYGAAVPPLPVTPMLPLWTVEHGSALGVTLGDAAEVSAIAEAAAANWLAWGLTA